MERVPARGLLARLSPSDRARLLGAGHRRVYEPREYLCREGEIGDHVAVILDGTVKVLLTASAGTTTTLGLCGAGELVGELSALDGAEAPRTATVVAVDTVTCCVVGHSRFRRLLTESPDMQRAITMQCADRMSMVAASKLQNATDPVLIRVVRLLLELAERYGRETEDGIVIDLVLSQHDLALLVVSSRESVVRSLAELRNQRLIRTARQRVTLCDVVALRRRYLAPV
ncbi:Crp/Fnr family transcriptional regulator [Nocardia sp. CS682]|uniref:Crp/Fnr family transcriptional regulator n=1 Tax=Nocardia sp. CS682 TaxID=1047172 RepID=UPI0010752116|nr:Crp/Fnr family transcriptional regulator [Nocardia sp. CS682]QBS44621.1 Crp/Fnr family transcriptional regulator [Nocardia sp. CS682]